MFCWRNRKSLISAVFLYIYLFFFLLLPILHIYHYKRKNYDKKKLTHILVWHTHTFRKSLRIYIYIFIGRKHWLMSFVKRKRKSWNEYIPILFLDILPCFFFLCGKFNGKSGKHYNWLTDDVYNTPDMCTLSHASVVTLSHFRS